MFFTVSLSIARICWDVQSLKDCGIVLTHNSRPANLCFYRGSHTYFMHFISRYWLLLTLLIPMQRENLLEDCTESFSDDCMSSWDGLEPCPIPELERWKRIDGWMYICLLKCSLSSISIYFFLLAYLIHFI